MSSGMVRVWTCDGCGSMAETDADDRDRPPAGWVHDNGNGWDWCNRDECERG